MYKKEYSKIYPEYQVDTDGVIYAKNGRPMHPSKNIYGYLAVTLRDKGKNVLVAVHTLVATQFVEGKTEKAKFVKHKDGNKLNNKASNLSWETRSETMKRVVKDNNYNSQRRKAVHIWNDKEDYTFESLCAAEAFLTKHLGFIWHRGNICSAIKRGSKAYGYSAEYLEESKAKEN